MKEVTFALGHLDNFYLLQVAHLFRLKAVNLLLVHRLHVFVQFTVADGADLVLEFGPVDV